MFSKNKGEGDSVLPPAKRKRVISEEDSKVEQPHCSGDSGDETGQSKSLSEGDVQVKELQAGQSGDGEAGQSGDEEAAGTTVAEDESIYYIDRHTPEETQYLIFKAFEDVSIFVDFHYPNKVWYMEKGTSPNRDSKFFNIEYLPLSEAAQMTTLRNMQHYMEKWERASHPGQPHSNDDLCTVFTIYDELSKFLQWDESKGWIVDHQKELLFMKKVHSISNTKLTLMKSFNEGSISMALRMGMAKACGKRALESIFRMASQVALGQTACIAEIFSVFPVGSSRAKEEKFPVDILCNASVANESGYNLRTTEKIACPPGTSVVPKWLAATQETDAGSNVSGVSSVSVSEYKGEVYADLWVVTSHQPMWPRHIFVAEVKKNELLTKSDKGQMIREMLAPVMRQSVCFGVLMNSTEAYLYTMERSVSVKDKIYVSANYYSFKPRVARWSGNGADSEEGVFSSRGLKALFIDIVIAMDYAKKNVKQLSDISFSAE